MLRARFDTCDEGLSDAYDRAILFCIPRTDMLLISRAATPLDGNYAVVVSQTTYSDGDWKPVVEGLVAKHHVTIIQYKESVTDSLPELVRQFPRYICFVARPAEAGAKFVANVNRLTRQLDDDPYTDALWGILTGYDAKARYGSPRSRSRW